MFVKRERELKRKLMIDFPLNFLVVIYLIMGLLFVKLEHNLLATSFNYSEMGKKDIVFCTLHQIIHYVRMIVMWPLYALDDFLIWLYNMNCNDNDDE